MGSLSWLYEKSYYLHYRRFLSFLSVPLSATGCRALSFFEGSCRAITVRMEDGRESIFLTVLVDDPGENKFGMPPGWHLAKNQARRNRAWNTCRTIINSITNSLQSIIISIFILCSEINYNYLAQNLSDPRHVLRVWISRRKNLYKKILIHSLTL